MGAKAAGTQVIDVGDIRVTYLPDGVASFAYGVFPGSSEECWARHAAQTSDGRWVCSIGSFLVESAGRNILVDLGFGKVELEIPDFATARSGTFMDNLATTGVKPSDVDTVIYTHMHADHTGWTITDEALTFDRARHLAGPGEVGYWTANVEAAFAPVGQLAYTGQFEESSDGQSVAPGVTIVHNSGHTPGHQVVVISSGTARAILLGDTIHSAAQLAEPDMTFMFDVDTAAARKWRTAWAEDLAATGDIAGACHFSAAAFGRVLTAQGRRYWGTV